MTVAELIKALQGCPQDHRVFYVGALAEHTELSAVGIGRIPETQNCFQHEVREMRSSLPEIDVVILK